MSATLDIYDQMFSSILQQNLQQNQADSLLDQVPAPKHSKVKAVLKDLQTRMEEVKGILKEMNQDREKVMAKLKTIKVRTVPPPSSLTPVCCFWFHSLNRIFSFHFKTTK